MSGKEISLQQVEAIGKLQGLPEEVLAGEKAMTVGVVEIVEKYYGSENQRPPRI